MKKLSSYLLIIVLSLGIIPTTITAADKNSTNVPKEIPAEIQVKLDRLNDIKNMDKSDLSSSEKKELRKEVKAIKADLRSTGNGLYLSFGAIIIILLLLILLL
ncbi:hypothetical protein [Flavobacterium sp. UMI-01]|uniref:hypothetical protein n=1 Tax=Flavobacterium sp. UMI-01 TaxID=1441053 RepID=UPI001C7D9810|nr:hypothetical protein [Flavobacterium sp. UMI-01]GIZ07707.1 hypothetical protein FUMI01_04340 [Flavobacterium sp. UMI-01]